MKTQKQILLLCFTVFAFLNHDHIFAQSLNLGVKGGVNISDINYEWKLYPESDYIHNVTGLSIYAFYDFVNWKYCSLSAEAGYVQKGYEFTIDYTNVQGQYNGVIETISSRTNYIEISVNAKGMLRGKTFTPYIIIGPNVGFYLGYSWESDGLLDSLVQNSENPLLEKLKEVTLGVNLGLGSEIKASKAVSFLAEIRYCPDLIYTYSATYLRIRNETLEFLAGVKF